MMQHYRTHMSPKSRRSQKRGVTEEARPRPRLHAHHRIRSDPVRVEPPLTIDQHLSNYHQSLRSPSNTTGVSSSSDRHTPVRFNFPLPLSATARSPSNLRKVVPTPIANIKHENTPSPTLSHSSCAASLPSIHYIIADKMNKPSTTRPTSPTIESTSTNISPSNSSSTLFYQHRPLTFTRPQNPSFPYTLLHPSQQQQQEEELSNVTRNQNSGNYLSPPEDDFKEDPMDEDNNGDEKNNSKSPSSSGLLQLAHIVSTFG